ncbi:MAG: IS66 family transposase [Chloroflexi bacterium]|nr:IS66 family transposase [Chloroflexota bacterium]
MTQDELAQKSRDELIDLVLAQFEQITKLRADYEALKLKLEKGKKPPTNSSNSSQPPSRDQKSNPPASRKKHRHGPPQGHPKHERKLVAEPDHVVEVKPLVCKQCQTDLSETTTVLVDVNQITELPDVKAEVIEVRQYTAACSCCGQEQIGEPSAGLEMNRTFGARLEGTVVYYRQEQHMSYIRTKSALRDLHGVEISQGGIDQIMQRGGRQAGRQMEPIQNEIQQSKVIHSDETGSRVDGQNWWQWVFCSATAVLHVIRSNRSADVIKDVMADHAAEVWVSDCYSAQMKSPARERQLCLAHQLRNLQAVVDRYPASFWPKTMQTMFRYAVHLHNRRDHLSPPEFLTQVQRVEHLCNWLLERSPEQTEAKRLLKRYHKYRDCLFVFLRRTDVSPTNNVSERNLRPSVVHRKVIGCFRSSWGAHAYAAIASVIGTAALKGISSFDAIQNLFGTPSLPLPTGV